MDPQKQLNDDGAVIGYSPRLDYDTSTKQSTEVFKTNELQQPDEPRKEYHSLKLLDFIRNMPNYPINKLNDLYDKTFDKLRYISSFFVPSKSKEYNDINLLLAAYDSNNKDYIDAFTDYHRNKIENGSVIPEIMTDIFYAINRSKEVADVCKKIIYGNKNITYDDMLQTDVTMANKLLELENTGDISKINYITMAYDSQLDRALSWYATNLTKGINVLTDIAVAQKSEGTYHDSTKSSSVKRLFDEINEEIGYMRFSYDMYHSIEVLDKTLYNYYNKRKEMLDLFDLSADTNNSAAIRARDKAMKSLDDTLSNIVKAFMGCHNYLTEISKYEDEKSDILSLYAGISSTV